MMRHERQTGQILIIFAGGLVTILLISALVIDLGFTFMLRRSLQNAADPGAIAAARYIRTGTGSTPEPTKMREVACFYAQQNGFFPGAGGDVDACTPANDPSATTLTVNYPPSAAAGSPYMGSTAYVEVILDQAHHSYLAGIVGIASIGVSSEAVAAFDAGDSNSSSLIALDPNNHCQAGKVHGTGDILIHPIAGAEGGYIHVNSTCGNGSPDSVCGTNGEGGFDIVGNSTVTAPHTYVAGTCKESGTLVGLLTEGAVQIGDPLAELPAPAVGTPDPGAECGVGTGTFTRPTGSGSNGCTFNGSATINLLPGIYYGGWKITNRPTLVLAPGIYIIAGGGISLQAGGTIESVLGPTGDPAPVLIFNTDNPVTHTGQANLDFNATATLALSALDFGPYRGILVWNDGKGSNPTAPITLGGQVSLNVSGTIYSPKGLVTMEGGTGVGAGSVNTAAVQIIAWQFDVGGNSNLDMPYDPNQLYHFPAKGLVH